jgi:hypothetical protein
MQYSEARNRLVVLFCKYRIRIQGFCSRLVLAAQDRPRPNQGTRPKDSSSIMDCIAASTAA